MSIVLSFVMPFAKGCQIKAATVTASAFLCGKKQLRCSSHSPNSNIQSPSSSTAAQTVDDVTPSNDVEIIAADIANVTASTALQTLAPQILEARNHLTGKNIILSDADLMHYVMHVQKIVAEKQAAKDLSMTVSVMHDQSIAAQKLKADYSALASVVTISVSAVSATIAYFEYVKPNLAAKKTAATVRAAAALAEEVTAAAVPEAAASAAAAKEKSYVPCFLSACGKKSE